MIIIARGREKVAIPLNHVDSVRSEKPVTTGGHDIGNPVTVVATKGGHVYAFADPNQEQFELIVDHLRKVDVLWQTNPSSV